jgi:hypothetical protein
MDCVDVQAGLMNEVDVKTYLQGEEETQCNRSQQQEKLVSRRAAGRSAEKCVFYLSGSLGRQQFPGPVIGLAGGICGILF